jgi:hypothetical protein
MESRGRQIMVVPAKQAHQCEYRPGGGTTGILVQVSWLQWPPPPPTLLRGGSVGPGPNQTCGAQPVLLQLRRVAEDAEGQSDVGGKGPSDSDTVVVTEELSAKVMTADEAAAAAAAAAATATAVAAAAGPESSLCPSPPPPRHGCMTRARAPPAPPPRSPPFRIHGRHRRLITR